MDDPAVMVGVAFSLWRSLGDGKPRLFFSTGLEFVLYTCCTAQVKSTLAPRWFKNHVSSIDPPPPLPQPQVDGSRNESLHSASYAVLFSFFFLVLVSENGRAVAIVFQQVHLATELHKHGVNMRHLGLLRAYVASPRSRNTEQQLSNTYATGFSAPSGDSGDIVATNGVLIGADGLLAASARAEVGSAGDGRRSSGRRSGSGGGGSSADWFAGKPSTAIMRDRALVSVQSVCGGEGGEGGLGVSEAIVTPCCSWRKDGRCVRLFVFCS